VGDGHTVGLVARCDHVVDDEFSDEETGQAGVDLGP